MRLTMRYAYQRLLRPDRGRFTGQVGQYLPPQVVEAQDARGAFEAHLLQVAKQAVHRGCSAADRAADGIPDGNDLSRGAASERYLGLMRRDVIRRRFRHSSDSSRVRLGPRGQIASGPGLRVAEQERSDQHAVWP